MSCENTYTLPCGEDCGLWCMPFNGSYNGIATIEWEYEETTYRKQIDIKITDPVCFLWPFQTYGIFIFKILDYESNPIDIEIDGQHYDCFRAVGIPSYDIPDEEREELELLCPSETEEIRITGRGTMQVLEWEIDNPPPGDDDWEIYVDITGRGTIEVDFVVEDQPDVEIEVEITGRGTLNILSYQLGDPPGFKYLLHGEDLCMQAFSFKRLWTGYNGFCCKVERWSDGALLDIGFNGGWRDDVALANFVKSGDAGIHTFYNQFGGGGSWTQPVQGLQPRIVENGVPVKVAGFFQNFPSCQFYGGRTFAGAGVGPWNGASHNLHWVGKSSLPTGPTLGGDPGGSEYAGFHANIAAGIYGGSGSPVTYVNNNILFIESAFYLRGIFAGMGIAHLWSNSIDFSGWTQTTFGIDSLGTFEGDLIEWVAFNQNTNGDRPTKTALTMDVFGL